MGDLRLASVEAHSIAQGGGGRKAGPSVSAGMTVLDGVMTVGAQGNDPFSTRLCTEMEESARVPTGHNARSDFSVCSRGTTLGVVVAVSYKRQPECPPRAVDAAGWAR